MIKAITFDFWSTLYQNNPLKSDERLSFLRDAIEGRKKTSIQMESLREAVNAARDAWGLAWVNEQRTMEAQEWLSIVLGELQITLAPEDQAEITRSIETTVLDNLPTLDEEAKTILPHLATDYRLAIISDTGLTPGRILHQVLQQDQVAVYFTHLTFSDEIGYSKPHPNAFLTTLKALGVEPQEAVHIGDLLRTDIAGAKQVGMRAVQYTGLYYDRSEASVTPDAVIQSHLELRSLLRHWNNGCRVGKGQRLDP